MRARKKSKLGKLRRGLKFACNILFRTVFETQEECMAASRKSERARVKRLLVEGKLGYRRKW